MQGTTIQYRRYINILWPGGFNIYHQVNIKKFHVQRTRKFSIDPRTNGDRFPELH